jgi:hypothetical protein
MSMFSTILQSSSEAYRNDFVEQVMFGNMYLPETKLQIGEIWDKKDVNWRDFFASRDFFLYDEKKTEQEMKLDLQLLIWDIFFPEQVFTAHQREIVRNWLQNHLSPLKWTDFNEIINRLQAELTNWDKLNYYNLLHFYYSTENNIVEMQHEMGTDKWFFRLKNHC